MPSDILIGSYPNLEAQSLSVTTAGPNTQACALAAGSYYLYDELGSDFHLLEALAAAIESHSVIGSVGCFITEGLRVRIESDVSFSMTWPSDNILRNLLGFTGSLSPTSTTHIATNISPLLWSVGKDRNPTDARRLTDGIPVRDIAVGQSGPGTMRATSYNRYRRNTLIYRYLANARVWTTAEAGGEYFTFFDQVLAERRRFKVWLSVPEVAGSTTQLDADGLGASATLPSTGAYVYNGQNEMQADREFAFVEYTHAITIPVTTTREFDAP